MQLAEVPDTEAEVSSTLAKMFLSIDDHEKSRPHFLRAMDPLRSQPLSSDLPDDQIRLVNTIRWLFEQEEALNLSLEN